MKKIFMLVLGMVFALMVAFTPCSYAGEAESTGMCMYWYSDHGCCVYENGEWVDGECYVPGPCEYGDGEALGEANIDDSIRFNRDGVRMTRAIEDMCADDD